MITQKQLQQRYDYLDGSLVSKLTGNIVGNPCGSEGRLKLTVLGSTYFIHRLIYFYFKGIMPIEVDHRDGNFLNNRIENLRPANSSQNKCNTVVPNSTGYRGVSKSGNKYKAKIKFNGIHYHIGLFETPEEASNAYKKKAIELHGDFATLTCRK